MFHASIYGPLDGGMVILQYNFAAGSFHTKKLCSKLYSIAIKFYLKKNKKSFEPPFGDLGVMYICHL